MCGTDSKTVINSLEFAGTAQQLSGQITIASLARVAEHLFNNQGTLDFSLTGGSDTRQRPRLHIEVRGEVHLRCQRCLGCLPYSLSTASDLLVLTGSEGANAEAIDDLDGVPAEPPAVVQDLVEDEVLLALPIVPRHPAGQCSTALDTQDTEDTRNVSPFAVLKQLKRN